MTDRRPFNPISIDNFGASTERALLDSPCEPLPPGEQFMGAGIYALYYHGDFPPYAPISAPGCDVPIYVGKAVPSGSRRGRGKIRQGFELWGRLQEHAESIDAATNLHLADFSCRYLVVDPPFFIPLGETLAIRRFKPVWNSGPIDGFGNHDPGSGRYAQKRSPWDVLHPGRGFADRLAAGKFDAAALASQVNDYFVGDLPPRPPTDDEGRLDEQPLPPAPPELRIG